MAAWEDAALEEALRAGRAVRVRARGQSMRPLLPDGSEVLIEPARRAPGIGDVVLTSSLGELALHRVVEIFWAAGRLYVRTRGDGRRAPDSPLPADAILGRAVEALVAGRRIRLDRAAGRALGWLAAKVLPWLRPLRR